MFDGVTVFDDRGVGGRDANEDVDVFRATLQEQVKSELANLNIISAP